VTKFVLEGLKLIKDIGDTLQDFPSINRRRNRIIKLLLLEESSRALNYLNSPPINKDAKDWLFIELYEPPLGYFYSKLFNSFYYLPITILKRPDNPYYKKVKESCEKLFEFQDKLYAGFRRNENKVSIVYADLLGTVGSASVTSLYCAVRILIYRQIFFSIMKSFDGDVEVPIGDSLLAIFKNHKNALKSCLKILPYVLDNDLKVVIGMTYGDDFLSNSNDRPIIGRDINLAVRLSELGLLSDHESIRVEIWDNTNNIWNNSVENMLREKVNTAIWIVDVEKDTSFNSLFTKNSVKNEIERNKLKLIKYIQEEENVKDYFHRFWGKIGYKKGNIYAILPENILPLPIC